ncbi:hypothetical protein RHSIM_Rhsim05G0169500 [Rhododendron simsii]|uniref:DUF7705 domain-containing protein n=1 Tax=Rhododendron simsii TaxID=118357 RepID=A0A834H0T8_RHOSS|nr:hypothetical protein RHSIM_Rhsim05G0169500 [Rhododendron simsii]
MVTQQKKGDGLIGDPRTWELDVGKLSQALYFYQDPGTKPVDKYWPSVNLGAEVYIGDNEILEWTVSDFDIIITRDETWQSYWQIYHHKVIRVSCTFEVQASLVPRKYWRLRP